MSVQKIRTRNSIEYKVTGFLTTVFSALFLFIIISGIAAFFLLPIAVVLWLLSMAFGG